MDEVLPPALAIVRVAFRTKFGSNCGNGFGCIRSKVLRRRGTHVSGGGNQGKCLTVRTRSHMQLGHGLRWRREL